MKYIRVFPPSGRIAVRIRSQRIGHKEISEGCGACSARETWMVFLGFQAQQDAELERAYQ